MSALSSNRVKVTSILALESRNSCNYSFTLLCHAGSAAFCAGKHLLPWQCGLLLTEIHNGYIMHTTKEWFIERFTPTGTANGFEITARLEQVQSAFQQIEIFDTRAWGKLMVIDGAIMLTSRDNFLYHEMISHPVLFTHPSPQNVTIIGGGDCGTLKEVLKHPGICQVTQCDIDVCVTQMAEKYFPELCVSNSDPRAHLLFEDGVAHVQTLADASMDVIIVDSTDPVGPAEGLFDLAFYKQCMRVLKPNGLLVQQSESPIGLLPWMQHMRKTMRLAGFASLQTLHFPQPCYPTGWWSVTMASKQEDFAFDYRYADVAVRGFATEYYCEKVHASARVLPPFVARAFALVS